MRIKLEKRQQDSTLQRYLSPLLAIILTLVSGALIFWLQNQNPVTGLYTFFILPINDLYGLAELGVKATPMLLCATGLALCFRANIWNIGAEGQLLMGALVGSWAALSFMDSNNTLTLPAILLTGCLAGLLWAAIPALLKVHFNTNEILTTIMLNYTALNLLLWGVHGPLKDPDGFNFPESALFSSHTTLPVILEGTRLHLGLILGLLAACITWVLLSRTFVGFQLKVIGHDERAARFAGYNGKKLIYFALLSSGALAGLAGISEVTGPIGQLIPQVSPGYGYAAIIVAFLGRLHPVGITLASLLMALVYMGGEMGQIDLGLPLALSHLFQGMLLFYLLACDVLIHYRLTFSTALTTATLPKTASPKTPQQDMT